MPETYGLIKGLGEMKYMNKIWLIGSIFAFLLMAGMVSATTYECDSYSSCQDAIDNAEVGDVIYMNDSISESGFTMDGLSGFVFDCDGNDITAGGYAFNLIDTDNVTIQDCNITAKEGIDLHSGSDGNVFNNIDILLTNSGSWYNGIQLMSADNVFNDIYMYGDELSRTNGVYLTGSSAVRNEFHNLSVVNYDFPVYLENDANENVIDCEGGVLFAVDSGRSDVISVFTDSNLISNCRVEGSTSMGAVYLDSGASGNVFDNIYSTETIDGRYNIGGIAIMGGCSDNIFRNFNFTYVSGGGFLFCDSGCDNMVVENAYVGDSESNIIYMQDGMTGVVVRNVTVGGYVNADYAFLFAWMNDSLIDGITMHNSPSVGIKIVSGNDYGYGYNNIIQNIDISGTDADVGIWSDSNSNTTFRNIDISLTLPDSMAFYFDCINDFENTWIEDAVVSADYGISYCRGDKLTVTKSHINGSYVGIDIAMTGSGDSQMTGVINDTSIVGASFRGLSIQGNAPNYFYSFKINNNFFDNAENVFFDGVHAWNTSKTLGTNIVGSSYLGGNFWSDFSPTCTDANFDGICDSAFGLDGSNIDWLPLTYQCYAPMVTIVSPANGATYNLTSVDLLVASDQGDNVSSWFYSLDGGEMESFAPNISLSVAVGSHNVTVYADNVCGNRGTATSSFTVSPPAPSTPNITITYPIGEYTYDVSVLGRVVNLTVSSSMNMSSWWYSLNGGNFTYWDGSVRNITSRDGMNTIAVYGNSTGGQIGSKVVTYYIANPYFTITCDQHLYRIYGNNFVAYCNITNPHAYKIKLPIEFWFDSMKAQFGENPNITKIQYRKFYEDKDKNWKDWEKFLFDDKKDPTKVAIKSDKNWDIDKYKTMEFKIYITVPYGSGGEWAVLMGKSELDPFWDSVDSPLVESGYGLGSFLTAITNPVVNIVLGLGIVGGILAVLYGLSGAIKRAVGGASRGIK